MSPWDIFKVSFFAMLGGIAAIMALLMVISVLIPW